MRNALEELVEIPNETELNDADMIEAHADLITSENDVAQFQDQLDRASQGSDNLVGMADAIADENSSELAVGIVQEQYNALINSLGVKRRLPATEGLGFSDRRKVVVESIKSLAADIWSKLVTFLKNLAVRVKYFFANLLDFGSKLGKKADQISAAAKKVMSAEPKAKSWSTLSEDGAPPYITNKLLTRHYEQAAVSEKFDISRIFMKDGDPSKLTDLIKSATIDSDKTIATYVEKISNTEKGMKADIDAMLKGDTQGFKSQLIKELDLNRIRAAEKEHGVYIHAPRGGVPVDIADLSKYINGIRIMARDSASSDRERMQNSGFAFTELNVPMLDLEVIPDLLKGVDGSLKKLKDLTKKIPDILVLANNLERDSTKAAGEDFDRRKLISALVRLLARLTVAGITQMRNGATGLLRSIVLHSSISVVKAAQAAKVDVPGFGLRFSQ